MRPGRRREGSVEGKKVVGGQLDISGGCVLSNVGRCSGAWDSADAVVLKDPRQRKLCRRGVVMPRNRVQRRVCEQAEPDIDRQRQLATMLHAPFGLVDKTGHLAPLEAPDSVARAIERVMSRIGEEAKP
jgi:hypothetical protein